jgi:hypothetical protein
VKSLQDFKISSTDRMNFQDFKRLLAAPLHDMGSLPAPAQDNALLRLSLTVTAEIIPPALILPTLEIIAGLPDYVVHFERRGRSGSCDDIRSSFRIKAHHSSGPF